MSLPEGLLTVGYQSLLRPVLFRAYQGDPEAIHDAMIHVLARVADNPAARTALGLLARTQGDPVTVAGVHFPGRVGLAAGMDKDGRAARVWQQLGFAFAELGTVTGMAQPGNDKPRVFRLQASQAIINRMGFNNAGAATLAAELSRHHIWRGNGAAGIPLGISIGKTKVVPVEDAIGDYLTSLRAVAPHADYIAVNVSSPNTPGLRSLQGADALDNLLASLVTEASALEAGLGQPPVPIWVKIAPDLTWEQIDDVLAVATSTGVAGVIATNTTLARDGLAAADRARAGEAGGLSGRPLTQRALDVVHYVTSHTELPVMGVGGIMRPSDATAMLDAGAVLVQLYTGFLYAGPGLIATINRLTRSHR